MLATLPPRITPMTAIVTTSSQAIETRIIDQNTGNTVACTYHNTLNEAIDRAETFPITALEIEELNF
jgi:hypothetical protein